MDRDKEYRDLFEKWTKIVNRMQERESWARDFGTGDLLYPSEIHTLQAIGECEGINTTCLAKRLGITTSGVSQMTRKLEKKGLVEKMRKPGNDKEILLGLTEKGKIAYLGHERHHRQIQNIINKDLDNYSDESLTLISEFLSRIDEISAELLSKRGCGRKEGDVHE